MGKATRNDTPRRLVVGITGASGVVLGVRLLEVLKDSAVETHLVMSKAAEMALGYETDLKPKDVRALAHKAYAIGDVGAAIASGTFPTLGMIILPCSIKSMSEVATGVTTTLLSRAADVTLKERRRLVLGLRETPLHGGHLRNLAALSDLGAIVAPIVPAFYTRPKTLQDVIDQTVGRLLEYFGIETKLAAHWPDDTGTKA
jgi:4-hydroxy-3-polyprenylbenzoate decarboxylase